MMAESGVYASDSMRPYREAIHQKRESLHRLFPEKYAPDVSVFTDGKVEIMFKMTYSQAENLARLMKGHDL